MLPILQSAITVDLMRHERGTSNSCSAVSISDTEFVCIYAGSLPMLSKFRMSSVSLCLEDR